LFKRDAIGEILEQVLRVNKCLCVLSWAAQVIDGCSPATNFRLLKIYRRIFLNSSWHFAKYFSIEHAIGSIDVYVKKAPSFAGAFSSLEDS
jgi:hypothetical protein